MALLGLTPTYPLSGGQARRVIIYLPDRTIPVMARWGYLLDLDKAG